MREGLSNAPMNTPDATSQPPPGRPSAPGRFPFITRLCFHLNWIFLVLWLVYLVGPESTGVVDLHRDGPVYGAFVAVFFLVHFVLISTGIIALFVVIIEVYSRRPVRGLRSVLVSFGLPIASFLYFSGRFLSEVGGWLDP